MLPETWFSLIRKIQVIQSDFDFIVRVHVLNVCCYKVKITFINYNLLYTLNSCITILHEISMSDISYFVSQQMFGGEAFVQLHR